MVTAPTLDHQTSTGLRISWTVTPPEDTETTTLTGVTVQIAMTNDFATVLATQTSSAGFSFDYFPDLAEQLTVHYARAKVTADVYDPETETTTSEDSAWSAVSASVPPEPPAIPTLEERGSSPQRIAVAVSNVDASMSQLLFQFSDSIDFDPILKEVVIENGPALAEYRVPEADREKTHYVSAISRRLTDVDPSTGEDYYIDSFFSDTLTVTRAGAVRPIDLDYVMTEYTVGNGSGYTYTVPDGARQLRVTLIGGGGGGGGGNGNASTSRGGGGGGGGMMVQRWLVATPGDTYYISVGRGGAGGTGANSSGTGYTDGEAGENSGIESADLSVKLTAYAGKGGKAGPNSSGAGGAGGGILDQSSTTPMGGMGASSSAATLIPEYGGGGGAAGSTTATAGNGGDSAYAAGAGGGGGGVSSGNARAGGAGGAGSLAGPGTYGSAGYDAGSSTTPGDTVYSSGTALFGSSGGGGGSGSTTATASSGRNGGGPGGGGGGGGGGGTSRAGGKGGNGADGAVYILAL